MKNLVFILLMFPLFSFCQTEQTTTYKHESIYNFLFDKDSVVIKITDKDSSVLSKSELLFIEKHYPELLDNEYLLSPDDAYLLINHVKDDTIFYNFSSETGQDYYYVIYGYLLSIRNGIDKYKTERKKLFEIYELINSINASLQHGGSGFGHMSWRIYGYTEYGIYLLSDFQDVQFDYSKQKELFIQSLKQYITDKVSADFDIDDKVKFKNKLFELVDKLEKEIDNYFYLSMARSFEYTYY